MLLFSSLNFALAADPIEHVTELFSKGNTQEIAKLFPANVDMGVMADVNTYTKAQAEQMLQKFFAQNKPLAAKVLHKVTSSATFNLAVILLTTDKGVYRVSCTLKDNKGVMQLVEVRIEGEKR
ncbi:hypothetical protein GCM10027049_08260 [Mucilaginibacter puniceus]